MPSDAAFYASIDLQSWLLFLDLDVRVSDLFILLGVFISIGNTGGID